MIQEQHGIAEVFHTFPKKFKQGFRGRGHEVNVLPATIGAALQQNDSTAILRLQSRLSPDQLYFRQVT